MNKMQAGFARLDMTPPLGVQMSGYFFERRGEGVLDPLYLNALAVKQGDKAAVVMTCDLEGIASSTMNEWVPKVAQAAGLPADAVLVACTHTHTGPHTPGGRMASDPQYDAWLFRRMCDAANMALRDCKPIVSVLSYEGDCKGVTYVRRFKMKDGHFQTWANHGDPNIAAYASAADESLRFVRLVREAADEIVLVNFQTHPDNISSNLYSADFPGFLRERVESEKPGTKCIFFNGAEGQLIAYDYWHAASAAPKGVTRYEGAKAIGHVLADFVVAHFEEAEPVEGEGVAFGQKMLSCRTKRDSARIPEALRLIDIHENGDEEKEIGPDWVATPLVAEAYTLQRLEKEGLDFIDILVSAVSVGGLAFLGIAGEPFCELGKLIRDKSPYAVTMVCCKANGSEGYYPTAEAYDQDGYEPRNTRFPRGIGEYLAQEGIELLQKIHA